MNEKPTQVELNTGSIRDLAHQITLLNENIDSLKQRVAALEAAPDVVGQQDFKPGWEEDDDNIYSCGVFPKEQILSIALETDGRNAELYIVQSHNHCASMPLGKEALKILQTCIDKVLKRMEADNADLSR